MRICEIENCFKKVAARGLCGMHYARLKRHGDTSISFRTHNGFINNYGYKMRHIPGRGDIGEHRIAMENKLFRSLTHEEIVHHIDGNKLNNSLSNLEIMTRSEHARLHHQKGFKLHPATKTSTHRWCGMCKTVKPISDFQICKRNRSGVQSQCRKCRKTLCHDSYKRRQLSHSK